MVRQGDLDGRGNLSERMLLERCRFFIGVCEDQVPFMTEMLDLGALKKRLHVLVLGKSQTEDTSAYRSELVVPLHYVLAAGPLSRGEFVQMTGLGERAARHSLSRPVADGLLRSDSPKGAVSLGFPLDQLHLLFPNLYPEAAAKPVDACGASCHALGHHLRPRHRDSCCGRLQSDRADRCGHVARG
ncbi:hypothetical protein [Thiomonas sp. FB-Cd]|uniref:hypothetical protein n=1 Tax=Thiomonas sp. FB-Cd TaxID=1158292 RepID=UPI0012DDC65A|nr:hypothetical protein [Thiomonas sp. FB-Cd]